MSRYSKKAFYTFLKHSFFSLIIKRKCVPEFWGCIVVLPITPLKCLQRTHFFAFLFTNLIELTFYSIISYFFIFVNPYSTFFHLNGIY